VAVLGTEYGHMKKAPISDATASKTVALLNLIGMMRQGWGFEHYTKDATLIGLTTIISTLTHQSSRSSFFIGGIG
jgi:hypothetical protein